MISDGEPGLGCAASERSATKAAAEASIWVMFWEACHVVLSDNAGVHACF